MPILRRSVVQFCSAPLVRFHTALDMVVGKEGNLVLVLDTQAKGDSVLSHQRVPVLLVGDPVPPSLLGKTLDVSPSFEGTQIILTD